MSLKFLQPAELSTLVGGHVANARLRNRMAVRVKRQMRPMINEAIELRREVARA